jgi:hypothetical protein
MAATVGVRGSPGETVFSAPIGLDFQTWYDTG